MRGQPVPELYFSTVNVLLSTQVVSVLETMSLKFNPEKLVHALAFFSRAGVRCLTKLKAAKLLYFADKEHLLRYGRPILGDVYYCLPYGPVPSVALNEMGDAIEKTEVEDSDANLFRQYLEVKKGFWNRYPIFKAILPYDPDVFSQSELEVLGHTVANTAAAVPGS